MKESYSTSVFNNRGFTLIEILIAITLLAFITLGVVSVMQNAFDTKERTTELNKNNLQIETALSRFEWDFSQIYSPLYFSKIMPLNGADPFASQPVDENADGLDDVSGRKLTDIQNDANALAANPERQEYLQRLQVRFEQNENFIGINLDGIPVPKIYAPEKGIIQFFTSSNRRKVENTRQSHFAWVRYQLISSDPNDIDDDQNPKIPKNLKNFVRYFKADNPYDDERMDPINGSANEKVKGAILLKNVESLEFQFWDMGKRKWEENLKTVQGGETVLRGIKMTLVYYDSFGEKKVAERTFRNHWPLVAPNDTPTRSQGNTTGSSQSTGDPQTGNDPDGT